MASNPVRSGRRRLALGGLITVTALSLAACGSFGGGGGGGDDDEAGGGDGTVTFWQYYGDPDSPTGGPLYDVLKAYDEENDDLTIDIRYIPFPDFNRTLTQAAAADELPDIALINAFDTQSMADAGVIEDLSDRVEEWGEQDA